MKLELQHVQQCYGEVTILKDLHLTIDTFQVLAIVGPSGSGKSTLLRLLAALDPLQSGNILIDGDPIPRQESAIYHYRQSIGIVFQSFNLFPHLTALANIALPLSLVHGFSKEASEARAYELLKRFSLADHALKKPAQLSGGQCQRIAILRAIAIKKRLLLFDEPTSALDPLMTAEVLDLIAELKEEGSLIIASHHLGFVQKVADHVIFLSDGHIIESLPTKQFFSAPAQTETRQFLQTILKYG